MNTIALLATLLAAALLVASPASADPLRYWGKDPGMPGGWIDLGEAGSFAVEAGTEIPGWGRVKAVTESHLVLERPLTGAEKLALREQDLLVYDVLEIHVPRRDLILVHPEPRN